MAQHFRYLLASGLRVERILVVVISLLLVLCFACNPTYAPPARINSYGAPAKFHKGQMETRASYHAENSFGVGLDYAPEDWVQLELGSDFAPLDHDFWMIYTGFRFAPLPSASQTSDLRFLFDIETGTAIGRGGESCGNNPDMSEPGDDCQWDGLGANDRLTGGGYLGTGIGVGIDFFDAFVRARIQLTQATGIPVTFWGTGLLGLQFTIVDLVKIYGGPGYGGYTNREDSDHGFLYEAGLGFTFDIPGLVEK